MQTSNGSWALDNANIGDINRLPWGTRHRPWTPPSFRNGYSFSNSTVGRGDAINGARQPESVLSSLVSHLFQSMREQPTYCATPPPSQPAVSCGWENIMEHLTEAVSSRNSQTQPRWRAPIERCSADLCQPLPNPSGGKIDLAAAIGILMDNFSSIACCGRVGLDELRAAASGNQGGNVAQAAALLLENPLILDGIRAAYEQVRGQSCGSGTGLSLDALRLGQRLASSAYSGSDTASALRLLESCFDKVAKNDGCDDLIGLADLEATAQDKQFPGLAAAARQVLNDPLARRGVDVAAQSLAGQSNPRPDELISRTDILAALRAMPSTHEEERILDELFRNQRSLWPNGAPLLRSQIRSIAYGGNLPDGSAPSRATRTALHQLLTSPALMDRLDSASYLDRLRRRQGSGTGHPPPVDGVLTLDDFQALRESIRRPAPSRYVEPIGIVPSPRMRAHDDVPPMTSSPTEPIYGHENLLGNFALAMISNIRNGGGDESLLDVLYNVLASSGPVAKPS